jgi:hypothetical protein
MVSPGSCIDSKLFLLTCAQVVYLEYRHSTLPLKWGLWQLSGRAVGGIVTLMANAASCTRQAIAVQLTSDHEATSDQAIGASRVILD